MACGAMNWGRAGGEVPSGWLHQACERPLIDPINASSLPHREPDDALRSVRVALQQQQPMAGCVLHNSIQTACCAAASCTPCSALEREGLKPGDALVDLLQIALPLLYVVCQAVTSGLVVGTVRL
eukprot:CAMPEP_0175423392 /NCGR_PEP_ID=MMETSP0095-20121207/48240_1 /TAXON_ID=311494 /ORGANISM="Alexandrium monilatum, Strain CCMP3105" /LENGTH=124 /DNA_ID=CAMNT_0016722651 /DNA_START=77 /DNA_END=448 /DNA_ORIENTATION=+